MAAARPGERGLFESGPRFTLLVLMLAAATTGPSVAVAIAGTAALSGSSGPASTPVVATAPAVTTVVVPDGESVEPAPLGPGQLSMARQQPGDSVPVPSPAAEHRRPIRAS